MTAAARPLRADAQRNRQRVLEVAQEVLATEGIGVPIDEIARRAGVGVGTLYRHFPTKEALLAAVVLSRIEGAAADARSLAKASDPGAAFFGFLERLARDGVAKRNLIDALAATGPEVKASYTDAFAAAKADMVAAAGKLLARAQRAGAVRRDVTIGDVLIMIHGPFTALARHGGDPGAHERLLAIVRDGLRARR
jgi:AcrR family transcriptional regulator